MRYFIKSDLGYFGQANGSDGGRGGGSCSTWSRLMDICHQGINVIADRFVRRLPEPGAQSPNQVVIGHRIPEGTEITQRSTKASYLSDLIFQQSNYLLMTLGSCVDVTIKWMRTSIIKRQIHIEKNCTREELTSPRPSYQRSTSSLSLTHRSSGRRCQTTLGCW